MARRLKRPSNAFTKSSSVVIDAMSTPHLFTTDASFCWRSYQSFAYFFLTLEEEVSTQTSAPVSISRRRTSPTSGISGGETFLVSLALALALSDVIGNNAVDTLFIDEGFGTLSDEYLTTAVDTLKQLSELKGRNVGIISHIQTLSERIPTQLRVRPGSSGLPSTVTLLS